VPTTRIDKVIYDQIKMNNLDCIKDGKGNTPNATMLDQLGLFGRPIAA